MSGLEVRGHSSNSCGQQVAAVSSTVTSILQCRQCQANTEGRKRPKDSRIICTLPTCSCTFSVKDRLTEINSAVLLQANCAAEAAVSVKAVLFLFGPGHCISHLMPTKACH